MHRIYAGTNEVMKQIEKIAKETPRIKKGIKHVTGISGQSFVLNAAGSNFGSLFVNLEAYPDRRDPSLSSDASGRDCSPEAV